MRGMSNDKIDFVIAWVDGSDPFWQAEKDKYSTENTFNYSAQYREWGILKYWFRMVSKNAPWVNKIHFVTCGHIPDWLDVTHPKLNIVKHSDFIPKQYLPTFSSHTIELNFHRIINLADKFIYFNDDFFLTDIVKKEDFFIKGKPCISGVFNITNNGDLNDVFPHALFNNLGVINKYSENKHKLIIQNLSKFFSLKYGLKYILINIYCSIPKWHLGFRNFHTAAPMLKSTYHELWEQEYEILDITSKHKFRDRDSVNQYVFSNYEIIKGNFFPKSVKFSKYFNVSDDIDEICACIKSKRDRKSVV